MGVRQLVSILSLLAVAPARAELPPVPFPVENPLTEQKRVLGKILFWDEQLSSDNTIACGSCHVPDDGGADPRVGVNPGPDSTPNTPDDIIGSPGVALVDSLGRPVVDPTFGLDGLVAARHLGAGDDRWRFVILPAPAIDWPGWATARGSPGPPPGKTR